MDNRIKEIAHHNGIDFIQLLLIEEMSELTKALVKERRRSGSVIENSIDIYEEMEDVEILLEQLKIMRMCGRAVQIMKDKKIERTLKRIREEEE